MKIYEIFLSWYGGWTILCWHTIIFVRLTVVLNDRLYYIWNFQTYKSSIKELNIQITYYWCLSLRIEYIIEITESVSNDKISLTIQDYVNKSFSKLILQLAYLVKYHTTSRCPSQVLERLIFYKWLLSPWHHRIELGQREAVWYPHGSFLPY